MPRKGNLKNLTANSGTTPEERKKRASKAGKASAEAKKKKKAFAEIAVTILNAKAKDKQSLVQIDDMGLDAKSMTYKDMTVIGMIDAARNGNVNAFEKLQELTNEKDTNETAEIFAKLDEVLAKVGDE